MERPDETEIDEALATAPGDSEKGYAADIAATMQELETRDRDREELEELLGPHREQIAANGHTDASYLRMLVGTAQVLGANPEVNDIAKHVHMESELRRFVKTHPDAAEQDFQYRMGLHLRDNPPKASETVAQSLARARKAVNAASKEPRNDREERQAAARDAWESIYGR
jgi:hypothetical protein